MEKETVNHPDHYKKGDRIECIELLDIITKGYEGIAAFDIGQVKYLYRAGSKFNDPKQKAKKALEDVNKFTFYIKDFMNRALTTLRYDPEFFLKYNLELPKGFSCSESKNECVLNAVALEFKFDKPKEIQSDFDNLIIKLSQIVNLNDVKIVLAYLENIRKYYLKMSEEN